MKKFLVVISVCLLGLLLFTSCKKDNGSEKQYYAYEATVFAHNSEVEVIDVVLAPRVAKGLYHLTEAQAVAEWNDFISKIDESKLKFAEGEYYTVTFNLLDTGATSAKPIKAVGTKTWK